MTARLLESCDIYFGPEERMMPPSQNNPDGYMEHLGFVEINREIYESAGCDWSRPPRLTKEWFESEAARRVRAKAERLLREFEGREPWGWKDPRNSATLPFWLHLFPDLKIVVCLRHPKEVALSLLRGSYFTEYSLNKTLWEMFPQLSNDASPLRRKLSDTRPGLLALRIFNQAQVRLSQSKRDSYANLLCLTIWALYNRRIIEDVTPEERVVTHYDSYFARPQAELRRVLSFLDMDVSEETAESASRLVSERMRHNRLASERRMELELSPEARELYQRLLEESSGALAETEIEERAGGTL